jgi:hypothetical protein
MPKPQFYIPQTRFWNRKLISESFVRIQLERSRQSYREITSALSLLEEVQHEIHRSILKDWGDANVQTMRSYEAKLRELGKERKTLNYLLMLMRERINDMLSLSRERDWNLK